MNFHELGPLLLSSHMRKSDLIVIILFLLTGFSTLAQKGDPRTDQPIVIMVSFDGFRYDYVEQFDAPNFKDFIKNGVSAEGLIPSFPSKTFPNHYSLVTGLYPGHHGLVDNSFFDTELDIRYSIGNREVVEDARFYGGTPLWQLVQENGMKSASYFWVGSEAPVKGRFPDYYHIYDGDVLNETRINAAMDWLALPETERPHFITLYFSLVDSEGHRSGPNSAAAKASVLEADRLLGLLMEGIEKVDLDVNVILVSDHGMHEILPERDNYISYDQLQDGLNSNDYTFVSNGAHAHFYINDEKHIKDIYQVLKSREDGYKTYLRKQFPKRWQYKEQNQTRIGDIIVTMNDGHYLSSTARIEENISQQQTRGEHGFDPYRMKDMQGIFYARGPQIKSGIQIKAFKNVHVYPFVAQLLGISDLPKIDGDIKVLRKLIK